MNLLHEFFNDLLNNKLELELFQEQMLTSSDDFVLIECHVFNVGHYFGYYFGDYQTLIDATENDLSIVIDKDDLIHAFEEYLDTINDELLSKLKSKIESF